SGVLERQLRSLRLRHRQRRDAAVAAITEHLPGCTIEGIAAGLHLLVRLPKHLDDADIAARARQVGVSVHPLSEHRFAAGPPGLVVGYGPHPIPRLQQAIEALGAIIRS
ncbi:MAG: PLP-dependent aminotransferase family protein, partial [Austwickia sp.]|nr:PLP-dependent aminotransferase family protein [Austwickia sp.]